LRLAEAAARQADFAAAPSDERFARALAAAKGGEKGGAGQGDAVTTIRDRSGAPLAEMRASARDLRLRLARKDDGAFARFLGARLPGLFDEFRANAAPAAKDD
jgi:hypothetical protein